ncbi:MarR family winged helix-turn-helix transcriptional regulator [Methylopila henanensis]|uniref:MarR family winged helix-turn-helix transcriptional regulator n=1 Tax=Methylopila henanensis TaxID=873516 RepID=A0ABW4K3Q0_9HYPH
MPDDARAANILAAFALALTDKVGDAMRETAEGRSPAAMAALIQIGFEPGLSIERLRACIALSHSATVRVADQLEAAGLIERRRGAAKDARVAALALTPAGEAAMRQSLAARQEVSARLLGLLTPREVETFLGLVERMLPAAVGPGADSDVVCRLCDLEACPQDRCPAAHRHGA